MSQGDAPIERVVTPLSVTKRLAKEGRWSEAEPIRDAMMRECRQKGMSKGQAQEWTYSELDRMYPPLPPPEPEPEPEVEAESEPEPEVEPEPEDGSGESDEGGNSLPVSEEAATVEADDDSLQPTRTREGLGSIPDAWLPLPDNATLPAELSWVQSQRLRIVEERSPGAVTVRLERAGCPAPSWGALGWLETSIRSYAKYVDVCAKSLGTQELDSDTARAERRSIEDVRRLLEESIK